MSGLHKWKKKVSEEPVSARELDKTLKRRLRISVGAGSFTNKDPVYHVGESFRQTFDLVGSERAAELGGQKPSLGSGGGVTFEGGMPEEKSFPAYESDSKQSKESQSGLLAKTSMDSIYAPSPGGENENFMSRFSQTAFNRGSMAGAVMRGSEKMMLVSCLRRATGQSQPNNVRQRMLFQSGASAKRNVTGHHSDKVVFNSGTVFSAVGLIVDSIKDARRTVNEMAELAEGENSLPEGGGAETLRKIYPFLNDSGEREQIAAYREMLKQLNPEDVEKHRILQRAANKAQAVLNRKQQMRQAFVRHLKKLSNRAEIAAELLESDGFREELIDRLVELSPPPEPPDDEDKDDESEE